MYSHYTLLQILSLITKGGGGSNTPPEQTLPPGYTQEQYDTLVNTIMDNTDLTKEQTQRILTNVLNKNTTLEEVDENTLIFKENNKAFHYNDPEDHETQIKFDMETLKLMVNGKGNYTIEEAMDAYYSVPEMNRALCDKLCFDDEYHGPGGCYNLRTHEIHINKDLLTDTEAQFKSADIYHTMFHEMGHALDGTLNNHYNSANAGNQFQRIMRYTGEKGSTYSELYNPKTSPYTIRDRDTHYAETIAEMVAVTRCARKFGGNNAYIEDPKVKIDPNTDYRGHDITYNQWKKENPTLAKFANKLIDCKNTYDIYLLFGDDDIMPFNPNLE